MVRHRKRKTERGFSENTMTSAVDMVMKQGYSIRGAAAEHNLKHNTLSRYVKKMRMIAPNEAVRMEPNYAWRKIFTSEEENEIKEYVLTYSKMNYALTKADLKKKVYEVALKNNKKIPTSWKTKKSAGDDWYYGFMERHPDLTLRKPSDTPSNEVITDFDTESAQLAEDPMRRLSGPNQDCSKLTGAVVTTVKASDAPDCIPVCFPVIVSDCSWPSSKDDTGSDNNMDLKEKLKEWVIKSGTHVVHVNSLLEILGSHFPQLPKYYHTLLQTGKAYTPVIIEKSEAESWEDFGATVQKDTDDNQKDEKSVQKLQTMVNTTDVDCSAGKRSCAWRHPSDDTSANENFCHKRKKTTNMAKSVPEVVNMNASSSTSTTRFDNSTQERSSTLCNNEKYLIEENEENLSERVRLIFTMMSEMKSMIKNNTLCLNNIANDFGSDYVMGSVDEFNLPMKSEFDIQKMEEDLLDKVKVKKLVRYLATLGGFSPKDMISRVMPHLFTNELTLNYDWSGKPPKKALGKLNIAFVIKEATKKSALNLTEAETENAVRIWLKNAGDRDGGC